MSSGWYADGMTDNDLLDLYSAYLISSFGQTTSTGLAALLGEIVSHDRITRFQAGCPARQRTRGTVRQIKSADDVLIVDDNVAEKPSTDENEILCWHYDHAQGRTVKGINFVTALYHSREVSLPVGFVLVATIEYYTDKKHGK
jgi:hypothetical protein